MHPNNWAQLYEYADVKRYSVIIKYKNDKGRLTNYVRVRTIIDTNDTSEFYVHVWNKRTVSNRLHQPCYEGRVRRLETECEATKKDRPKPPFGAELGRNTTEREKC